MINQRKGRGKTYSSNIKKAVNNNPWFKNRILVVPKFRIQNMKDLDRDSLLRINFGTGTDADFLQLKETFAVGWMLSELVSGTRDSKIIIAQGMHFLNIWKNERRKPYDGEFPEFNKAYEKVYELFSHAPLEELFNCYQLIVKDDNIKLPVAFIKGSIDLMNSAELMSLHTDKEVLLRQKNRLKSK